MKNKIENNENTNQQYIDDFYNWLDNYTQTF